MTPDLALLLIALVGILGTATFAILADVRRIERDRANAALSECQAQMMRGAAVLHHKRPNPHKWADPELEVVRTDAGGLAFTDAEWSRARARFDAIQPELPHA